MSSGMDKDLMALMGLEDDRPLDDGLATQLLNRSQSQEPSILFEPMSDSDTDLPSDLPKTTYLLDRQSQPQPPSECRPSPPSPPLAPRANTSALFTPSRLPRSPSPQRSNAVSLSLFSPGLNPSKVRVAKSPKKKRGAGNDLSMFSPTLSPRKPRRVAWSPPLPSPSYAPKSPLIRSPAITAPSRDKDVRTTSLSPDLTPTPGRKRGPVSPLSSYDLQKQTLALSDNDSDISSLEDTYNNSASLSASQKVSLRASFTLDANMSMDLDSATDDELPTVDEATKEAPAANRFLSQDDGNNIEAHRNAKDERDLDDIMSSHAGASKATKKSKAAIQAEQIQIQMEKERLMRSSTFKVDQRFKKQTLSTLLESAQSKLKGQPIVSQTVLPGPNVQRAPLKKSLPRTIALDDSSEDETEQDAERREEEAQWKHSATKALLLSSIPKRERSLISQELKAGTGPVPIERRLELERALQMSPLSNRIQSMNLNKTPATSSSSSSLTLSTIISPPPKPDFSQSLGMRLTSPQRSQRTNTVANIQQFNLQMERQLAKAHLVRRKKLEDEAKRSGTWRSPEDHAAEQLRIEEKRSQGLDPDEDADDEEDGDYYPEGKIAEEGDSEMDRGSENQLGSEESDDEIEREGVERLEAPGQDSGQEPTVGDGDEVRGGEDGKDDDDDDDGEDDEDKDTDEDEEEMVAPVKKTRRKTVIGDDEDLKVVIVDRSQAIVDSDSDDQDGVSRADEFGSGSDVGEDDDVSDIDQDMKGIDGTQGFGAFFESSYDLSKPKKAGALSAFGRAPASVTDSSLSPIVSSDPSQIPASYGNTQGSIDGALDFLSGKFPTQIQYDRSSFAASASSESQVPPTLGSQGSIEFESQIPRGMEPRFFDDDDLNETTSDPALSRSRNAFEVMSMAMNQESGLRRLHKREAKPKRAPISKAEKSAFIEYEAEEEEDEHMGMGGIDYESDVDQDDYDLGDGMVDTNVVLDSQDVENVKQLHMKHEQDQHDKEISDLVHGIAAGNLWKRRNGQIDDLDLFDEEDMDGRFRRKKKLKVSEKFEMLADNPNTAAFARAFKKNMDDDQLIFLSDADESAEEDGSSKDDQGGPLSVVKDQQHRMSDDAELSEKDEEGELLNTDKRQERLRKARLVRDESDQSFYGSMDPDAITSMTKGQVLPFVVASEGDRIAGDSRTLMTPSTSTPVRGTSKATDSLTPGISASQGDAIDEYKDVMRRTKVIRDILDGVDEVVEDGSMTSPSRARSSLFGLQDRIVDRTSLSDSSVARPPVDASSEFVQGSSHNDVDVSAIVRPRLLARQNSSFLSEDRRNQFLSTVGEDSRGGNASTRVVKEVNRRKMAFATSKKSTSTGSLSTSSSAAAVTVTSSTTTSTTTAATSVTRTAKIANLKNMGVQRAMSASGSGRLLQILSLEGEE
ncbi:hypothetical protein EC957_002673 [Mortierella hygrophila]|uniref:DNA replication checkpoint mediator MRC1 domain-containing protein n=1 Tax=Mortierella hygrophila TaxID=979708 RepID=A0A9P6F4I0_9FUNG|nr:hypothetical protein EC957_002673 [Mortierella hygrophila]